MEFDIVKIAKGKRESLKDVVAAEVPLTVHLNGKELVTLLCSPDHLKELSAGFLYSTGIIQSAGDVKKIIVDGKNMASYVEVIGEVPAEELLFKRMYTSGCGRGVFFYKTSDLSSRGEIKSDLRVSAGSVGKLMKLFEKRAAGFKETGGFHSAALSDGEKILVFMEDIGRHNALDKILGEALFKKLEFKRLLVLTSGRVSSEIIFKVLKTGSPVLVSRSAPTDQAVKIARSSNLTLVGFARGERMNIYSGEERID